MALVHAILSLLNVQSVDSRNSTQAAHNGTSDPRRLFNKRNITVDLGLQMSTKREWLHVSCYIRTYAMILGMFIDEPRSNTIQG
jgi:hypothetical protein